MLSLGNNRQPEIDTPKRRSFDEAVSESYLPLLNSPPAAVNFMTLAGTTYPISQDLAGRKKGRRLQQEGAPRLSASTSISAAASLYRIDFSLLPLRTKHSSNRTKHHAASTPRFVPLLISSPTWWRVRLINPILFRPRARRCAACRLRCPMTASAALGPTDGQGGLGQGLLHHSTRAAVPECLWGHVVGGLGASAVLPVDLTPDWHPKAGLARPRISVWTHRRMFATGKRFQSHQGSICPLGLSCCWGDASRRSVSTTEFTAAHCVCDLRVIDVCITLYQIRQDT
ncbi:hypothetical protein HDV57DRAFT_18838 [Trichoderma longibrachiatum]